jgi:hypothetical protein
VWGIDIAISGDWGNPGIFSFCIIDTSQIADIIKVSASNGVNDMATQIFNIGHNGIPKRVQNQLPFGVRTMRYSKHAITEAHKDRYGKVKLPASVDMAIAEIVEVETEDKVLSKVVFRVPQGEGNHAVYVGIPQSGGFFVKTTWINRADDNHATLRKGRLS